MHKLHHFSFSRLLLLASGSLLAAAGYMLFEAQWLQLKRRELVLTGLPDSLNGLKLLHISDLHAGAPGVNSRAITKAIAAARETAPDLVLFTGDMVDKQRDLSPYLPLLANIVAPLGKFAVLGNHDHGRRKTVLQDLARRFSGRTPGPGAAAASESAVVTVERNRQLLGQAGIQLLENECITVIAAQERLQICGIDDFQYGYADFDGTARQIDRRISLRVLLSHSPDAAAYIGRGDYHLVLAGHTHGGQICLPHPVKGKLPLSTSGSGYIEGVYPLPQAMMHVSRGVGTTLMPLRLLSRPEITLLTLIST